MGVGGFFKSIGRGFKKVGKGLGKGLLKAAPFAAMAIPGVGGALGGALKGLGGGGGRFAKGLLGGMDGRGDDEGDDRGGLGGALGALGPVLGQYAAGRAQGRQAESQQLMDETDTRARLSRLLGERAQFELNAPNMRAQQATQGDYLSGARRLRSIPREGEAWGKTEDQPMRFGANAQEAGRRLSILGLGQLGKDTYAVPDMPQMPRANMLDKVLGVAGPITAGIGALQNRGGGYDAGDEPELQPAIAQRPSVAGQLAGQGFDEEDEFLPPVRPPANRRLFGGVRLGGQ